MSKQPLIINLLWGLWRQRRDYEQSKLWWRTSRANCKHLWHWDGWGCDCGEDSECRYDWIAGCGMEILQKLRTGIAVDYMNQPSRTAAQRESQLGCFFFYISEDFAKQKTGFFRRPYCGTTFWTIFWTGCWRKVVAEKLLLGLFSIGWTFFQCHRRDNHNGAIFFLQIWYPRAAWKNQFFFQENLQISKPSWDSLCAVPSFSTIQHLWTGII